MYRVLPYQGGDPRAVAEVLNNAMNGKTNNTGTITLADGGATSTTLSDERIGYDSVILLEPITNNAAHSGIAYAQFTNNANQTATAATRTEVIWANAPQNQGFELVGGAPATQIKFLNTGVYQISFVLHFASDNANVENVTTWLNRNGTDGPTSSVTQTIAAKHGSIKGSSVVSRTLISSFNANDVIKLYWVNESVAYLSAEAASVSPVYPSGASSTLAIHQVDNGFNNVFVSSTGKGEATLTHPINNLSDMNYRYIIVG